MLIYVSHPYGGKKENEEKVENIIHDLISKNPVNVYISPIHAFSFAYNSYPYKQGLDMCLKLLDKCDTILVCEGWEGSRGCKAEIEYANKKGIPCRFLKERTD